MTRRIPASIDELDLRKPPPHPGLRSTAQVTVQARVEIDGFRSVVDFRLDTGADSTALSPKDAFKVLKESYLDMVYAPTTENFELLGVGGVISALVRPAQITLFDEDGLPFPVALSVLVMRPSPRRPGEQGGWENWDMPSLLGLDILHYFDLHLSYHPPSAVLEEASASS